MRRDIPEPWRSFLGELDGQLDREVSLHCNGGFVVAMCCGLERPTGDVDFLAIVPSDAETVPLDMATLRNRYESEMRPYLANVAREDLTLKLWIEDIEERREGTKGP